jgi:hypothetical protein
MHYVSNVKLWGNGVKFDSTLVYNGILVVDVYQTTQRCIGKKYLINSILI